MPNADHRLAEAIIDPIRQGLSAEDFDFDDASQCFAKRSGDFVQQFQMAFADVRGRLVCVPEVGVRSELVEEIFHRTSEYSESNSASTATLGVSVKLLTGSEDFDLVLVDTDDVDPAIDRAKSAFRDVAVPYFAQYCSLKQIDAALNDNPEEPCIHMLNERARCSRGLIVAKLLNRRNYSELVQIYDRKVARAGAMTYKKYFRPLVAELEQVRALHESTESQMD